MTHTTAPHAQPRRSERVALSEILPPVCGGHEAYHGPMRPVGSSGGRSEHRRYDFACDRDRCANRVTVEVPALSSTAPVVFAGPAYLKTETELMPDDEVELRAIELRCGCCSKSLVADGSGSKAREGVLALGFRCESCSTSVQFRLDRKPEGRPVRSHSLAVGDVVKDRFYIEGLLGRGGTADVYRAEDRRLKRAVALKALRPEHLDERAFRLRLRSEVRFGTQVCHPNVRRTFELHEARHHLFSTLELIDGGSLRQLLDSPVEHLTEDGKLRRAIELCRGLAAIHHQGIVHRNLHPSNVLIARDGSAVITDFGLADDEHAVFDPASGTQGYFAPEQLAGSFPSRKSDLYALGLILFELFAGRHPFAEAATREQLEKLQGAGDRFLGTGPGAALGAVGRTIRACLAVDPDERPPTAETVEQMLGEDGEAAGHGASQRVHWPLPVPGEGWGGRRVRSVLTAAGPMNPGSQSRRHPTGLDLTPAPRTRRVGPPFTS